MNIRPYAEKKFAEINGVRMAYLDEGRGDPIVFQHGNPTSAYLWRNVMPHLEGLGRLIACDLVGMGDSGKLPHSGPDRYSYQEQRDYLFALWEHLGIGDDAVFVLHDWGSALGFDWAFHNRHRVAGIAYMEAIVAPMTWENDWRDSPRRTFQALRSPAGESMVLTDNLFVEGVMPTGILRDLSEEEMAVYRTPYLTPGESRRPTLSWPRQLPIDGEPAEVVRIVEEYGRWLATSTMPKLFVNAEPGAILIRSQREFCRTWPNQTEVTVPGAHFVQEDSPDLIGAAVADFVRGIRGTGPDE
ncbi:haloalkane dehalogenase [Streptosporangium sp. 'caverna']|uniref:haloalkane dehalogenase n=1 Tax=Streptosporangium sp. 'caverna' TaxID=2202249 RepID=UPI000D7DBED7|nr:haloalkane dehalogenase [Streptosporangium sp. 'caverna']AWS43225.1 haloalkane dehalogenase [Streptosporangium sp. 'caverna']